MKRIIAIASGKGGVGKTWLAVSLADALSRRGGRVLLFDGDVGLANVDVQLGLLSGPHLGHVLIDRQELATCIKQPDGLGFDVVSGCSGTGCLAGLEEAVLQLLAAELRRLQDLYDAIIVDLPSGVSRSLLSCMALASDRLVVLADEPTSLTDSYAVIKLMQRYHPEQRLKIAVNLAGDLNSGRRTHEGFARICQKFLKLDPDLAGILRRDSCVGEAIRLQTPLLQLNPKSKAAIDVVALADSLTISDLNH